MQVPPSPIPTCLPNIRRALSDQRLDAYRIQTSQDELDLLARYAWNMDLGSSLYIPLQILEVVLRNTLHSALTQHYRGNERWYQLNHAFQNQKTWDKAQEATRQVAKVTSLSSAEALGRVIAQLDFGFWTTLLTSQYGRPKSASRNWTPLWPRLVPIAFPNFPNPSNTGRDRAILAERFDNIRQLRNRVSHHEPIWKGRPDPRSQGRVMLNDQYNEILEAVEWVSPDSVYVVRRLSNFPSIYAQGPVPYRKQLETLP